MPMILPDRLDYWKTKDYLTYRRLWLDVGLVAFSADMRGVVLDLGGIRENKRGTFQPPETQAKAWWYVNLNMDTKPNVFADVTRVPVQSRSVDYIICTEVLEHLKDPQACVDEIHRLLRADGAVLASVPFFYPMHADPYDFQRFTEDGLRHLFRDFSSVEVLRMGGYLGVLGMLVELGITGVQGNGLFARFTRWGMKWLSRALCRTDLALWGRENVHWQKYTTGYFVYARHQENENTK